MLNRLALNTLGLMSGLVMLCSSHVFAAEPELPQYAASKHLGVASCSSSTCHGSIRPWQNANVLQNEYITWSREDAHAKAYKILFNKASKRIVRNLGLKEPAHEAKICLDCHADNVPADKRGERFQIADGVGCESCHGGAGTWIETHTTGKESHTESVKKGLYPTEDPVSRATLCYSCHFGDENKFVTHRIMGAGHPRMSFELDTFSAIQPAHYKIDKDYKERKPVITGIKMWALGQAVAMRENLDALLDKRGQDGVFPELVLFDCHACHHPMSDKRWSPRSGTGLPPGVVRYNDANFIMLRHIAGVVDANLAKQLRSETRALHRSVIQGRSAATTAATNLRNTTRTVIDRVVAHDFSGADVLAIIDSIIAEGLQGEYSDYASAEQTTMATGNVITVLEKSGAASDAQLKILNAALDKLYEATANDEKYQQHKFTTALRGVKSALPK